MSRKLKTYCIVFVALIANLAIAETILYVYFPQPVYPIKYSPWGWEHLPKISFKYTTESKEIVSYITYNSEGFRGPDEYSLDRRESTLRIAVLGDSEAEGNSVSHPDYFAYKLEEKLGSYYQKNRATDFDAVEVIKAGVYSYEPCQFLRLFESRVLKYKPDLVIVMHNQKFSGNVFCRLENKKLMFLDMEYSRIQYLTRYVLSYIKAKSQLVNYLYTVYRYQLGGGIHFPELLNQNMFTYAPRNLEKYQFQVRPESVGLDKYMNSLRGVEEFPTDVAGEQLMEAVYKRFQDNIKLYGGDFVVVVISEDWKNGALSRMLEKQKIPYFDLASYLSDSAEQEYVLPKGVHWNSYGHALVANALSNYVLRLGYH